MGRRLLLTIPLAPSVNHCYFTTKSGQRILKKDAKDWIETVKALARREAVKQGWTPVENRKLVMEIMTYWRDNRRHDVHNGVKLTADALEGVLYNDDKWVLPRYIDFDVDKENPRLEIVLRLLDLKNDKWYFERG